MKITTVRYRKLISLPGYENKAVEAEATVEKGESPEDALTALAEWVRAQLTGTSTMDIDTLRNEVNFLHGQRQQLRGAVEHARIEEKKVREQIVELEVKREKLGGEPAIPF